MSKSKLTPLAELKALGAPRADWDEIERIAKMALEANPCPHNTLVNICRALLETRR